MMMLRAEAAQAQAFGFSLLAAEYGSKIAAARQRYSGDELAAALAALHSEQKAAERALRVRLSAEARNRRRAMLATFQGKKPITRKDYRRAALEATARAKPAKPRRPRRRARDRAKPPRPRR